MTAPILERIATAGLALGIAVGPVASADTLLLEFDTRVSSADLQIPSQYADLNARFDENPTNGEFYFRLVLPDFQRFSEGEHEVPLNVGNPLNWGPTRDDPTSIKTEGLAVTLDSRAFGPLEGLRSRVQTKDADGKEVRGAVLLPDETQIADAGMLSISDGKIVRLTYAWIEADNPGLMSMNEFLVKRRGFPVSMTSFSIDVSAFSDPAKVGDIVMVRGLSPEVAVGMAPTEAGAVED